MPAGLLVTVPSPPPVLETVSGKVAAKFAVTVMLWLSVIAHWFCAFTLGQPVQPVKTEPDAAVAVRRNVVPAGAVTEHTVPQLMALVTLCTVPCPVPVFWTVRVRALVNAIVSWTVSAR